MCISLRLNRLSLSAGQNRQAWWDYCWRISDRKIDNREIERVLEKIYKENAGRPQIRQQPKPFYTRPYNFVLGHGDYGVLIPIKGSSNHQKGGLGHVYAQV